MPLSRNWAFAASLSIWRPARATMWRALSCADRGLTNSADSRERAPAMNAPEAVDIIEAATPATRHSRQARVVWGDHVVTVGGGAPVRLAEHDQHRHRGRHRHRHPVQGTGAGGQRTGAHHRQHARGRRGRAARARAARPHGHPRAAGGRLPLQRPPPADRLPGHGAGAQQVPHQPRQRGQGRQARPPVRDDGRGRRQVRQGGAHRRELGQPGPGTAGRADGPERAPRRSRWTPSR